MAKGIIIMDIPQDCYRCDLVTGYGECMVTGETVDHSPHGSRSESCPINPMPDRMHMKWDDYACAESYDAGMRRGYNRCIDDILGGYDEQQEERQGGRA